MLTTGYWRASLIIFSDIKQARMAYEGKIIILQGLEFDYMPGSKPSHVTCWRATR